MNAHVKVRNTAAPSPRPHCLRRSSHRLVRPTRRSSARDQLRPEASKRARHEGRATRPSGWRRRFVRGDGELPAEDRGRARCRRIPAGEGEAGRARRRSLQPARDDRKRNRAECLSRRQCDGYERLGRLDRPAARSCDVADAYRLLCRADRALLRTDASVDVVSALEDSTLAKNLDAAPGLGSNATSSARSAIVPIVNGPRGKSNRQRQGLQSAVLGEGSPLNITQSLPGARDYSPIWDVHPAAWSKEAVSSGHRKRLTSSAQIAAAVRAGRLTSGGTGPANPSLGGLRAANFISNCPTVAIGT